MKPLCLDLAIMIHALEIVSSGKHEGAGMSELEFEALLMQEVP